MKPIFLAVLCLALAGCGITKKNISTTSSQTELKAESAQKTNIKTEASKATEKKSSTVITEKVDTNITIPENTVTAAKDLDELIRSGILFAQDGPTSITVTYDEETKSIKAVGKTESHDVPVTATKITEIDEAVQTAEDVKSDEKTQQTANVHQEQNNETKQVETNRNTVPGGMLTSMIIVLLIILALFYLKERFFR